MVSTSRRKFIARAVAFGITIFFGDFVRAGSDKGDEKVVGQKKTVIEQDRIHRHEEKVANWGEIRYGDDGHQDGGVLTFRSDGKGRWDCRTWTTHTHSGDTWHSTFIVRDSAGRQLFLLGQWDSPREDDQHNGVQQFYSWGDDFTFDASKFEAISKVEQRFSA